MHCSCRAAPLRTFINGLAQVHRLESSAAPRSYISASRSKPFLQDLSIARHGRLFHQSRFLSDNAAESDVNAAKVAKAEKTEHNAAEGSPSSSVLAELQTPPARTETPSSKNSEFYAGIDEVRSPGRPRIRTNQSTTHPSERPRLNNGKFNINLDRAKFDGASLQRRGNYSGPRTGPGRAFDQQTDSKQVQGLEQKPDQRNGSGSSAEPSSTSQAQTKDVEPWRIQKERLKAKFPEGWKPIKRLSPDALAGIRALNAQFPDIYTTKNLAAKFEVSAEHIRRILKSQWQPTVDEEQARQERWHRRGMQIWENKAALGVKPPRKWRSEGITRDPRYHDRRKARIQRDKLWEEQETNKYRAYREGLKKAAGKVV